LPEEHDEIQVRGEMIRIHLVKNGTHIEYVLLTKREWQRFLEKLEAESA